jgi:hypothetical protein
LSALTKTFVVLLIVCSLLLSAATVIFVNRTEEFRAALETSRDQIAKLTKQATDSKQEADAARLREENAVREQQKTVQDLQLQVTASKQEIATRDGKITELNTKIAVQDANISDLVNNQKLSQQYLADLQKRHDTLVADYDKLRAADAELVAANTDFQKRLDIAERELRILAEQNTQLRKEHGQALSLLQKHNIPLETAARKPLASNLRGVIREVTTHDGVKYATISLGSVDKVEKGMQFNVVHQQTFLGKLTIEAVEPNAAFGRLEGPRIQDVQPDNTVMSEL